MHRSLRLAACSLAALLAALLAACASTPPPDPATVIRQAEQALGSTALKTLVISGRGSGGTFGQAWPGPA